MHAPDAEASEIIAKGENQNVAKPYVTVRAETSLWDVVARTRAEDASMAVVTSQDGPILEDGIRGVIMFIDVLDSFVVDMELFA